MRSFPGQGPGHQISFNTMLCSKTSLVRFRRTGRCISVQRTRGTLILPEATHRHGPSVPILFPAPGLLRRSVLISTIASLISLGPVKYTSEALAVGNNVFFDLKLEGAPAGKFQPSRCYWGRGARSHPCMRISEWSNRSTLDILSHCLFVISPPCCALRTQGGSLLNFLMT